MDASIKAYDSYIAQNNARYSLSTNIREDLDIDALFEKIDYTSSCVGRQFLYHVLCTDKKSVIHQHENFIKALSSNIDLRDKIVKLMLNLNHNDAYTIVDILKERTHIYPKMFQYLLQICRWLPLMFLSLSFIINSPICFYLFLLSYITNGYFHFKQKNVLSCYYFSIPQLYKLLTVAHKLQNISSCNIINDETKKSIINLSLLHKKLKTFRFNITMESDIAIAFYISMEFINIFTLSSAINIMNSFLAIDKDKKDIEHVFGYVGLMDTLCSISFLRENISYYCLPKNNKEGERLYTEAVYHPLIKDCIPNSITIADKSILITGSNMSGKTSFIKTVVVNLLMAKTINTCFAKNFEYIPNINICSAICIKDNLLEGKSYFFKEAENVKLIIEKGKEGGNIIVLDELFKGTNTTERIAINMAVMSKLSECGNIVLASTHDLKLAELLNKEYEFYHFSESIENNKLLFDYKLKKGTVPMIHSRYSTF